MPKSLSPRDFTAMPTWIAAQRKPWSILFVFYGEQMFFAQGDHDKFVAVAKELEDCESAMVIVYEEVGKNVHISGCAYKDGAWVGLTGEAVLRAVTLGSKPGVKRVMHDWHVVNPLSPIEGHLEAGDMSTSSRQPHIFEYLQKQKLPKGSIIEVVSHVMVNSEQFRKSSTRVSESNWEEKDDLLDYLATQDNLRAAWVLVLQPAKRKGEYRGAVALFHEGAWAALPAAYTHKYPEQVDPLAFFDSDKIEMEDWSKMFPGSPAISAQVT